MKKRQIKKNGKKIAEKLTEYASSIKELEVLGVFSIARSCNRQSIECHVRLEDLVKLPFAKTVGFEFREFDEDSIEALVKIGEFTFFAIADDKKRAKYFPGKLDVKPYE